MAKFTWNEENTATLTGLAGDMSTVITQEALEQITVGLEGASKRSVGSKLRKMGYEVDKATAKPSAWTAEETSGLVEFVEANAGEFNYAEIAAQYLEGKFSTRQVQGKILSLELTANVKPTPRELNTVKSYSDAEEVQFITLANAGSSIETIAEALGRTVPQVRGKALSLCQQERIAAMPHTANKKSSESVDVLAGLNVAEMSVEDIVAATGKSDRGVKSMLSRRGVNCADYKGADKKAKNEAKRQED